jgi:hypothetical protein
MPPLRVLGFSLWFHYQMPERELTIDYTPIACDEAGKEHHLTDYKTQFRRVHETIPESLRQKLARLAEHAESQLTVPEIEIEGIAARGAPRLRYFQVAFGGPASSELRIRKLHVVYYLTPNDRTPVSRDVELTEAARRLINNIYPMCEQAAWSHLRERLGYPAEPTTNPKQKVFLSYRKGNDERDRFIEAVAHRLGREGFRPWLDKWEIKAGDSIARELASGFQDVYGMVILLSADYPGGSWARQEMETAITKRTEENIKIIPILYEDCERPELLRPLRYVDCRNHSEDNFERQFSDVIDALNEIELNPYR